MKSLYRTMMNHLFSSTSNLDNKAFCSKENMKTYSGVTEIDIICELFLIESTWEAINYHNIYELFSIECLSV